MPFDFPSLPPCLSETMHRLKKHMLYLESIAEPIKLSSSIEQQSAGTYLRKWQIPMTARIYSKFTWKTPVSSNATLNATTSARCSRPTDRTINELENNFIGKHPFEVFTPLTYSGQQKFRYHLKKNRHERRNNNEIDFWSIQYSSLYIFERCKLLTVLYQTFKISSIFFRVMKTFCTDCYIEFCIQLLSPEGWKPNKLTSVSYLKLHRFSSKRWKPLSVLEY